jgi:Tol biopolymer transport system component
MELVDGPTLADRIAAGPIPLDEALVMARQIAEALEAAHERGIIHRDLKPSNIKLGADGTVKVLDFGLAKALDSTSAASTVNAMNSPTVTTPLGGAQGPRPTELGVLLGTVAYMAPEQVKGKTVDARADIWAFGVVLFEMLAGRGPFTGGDVSETLADILRSEPAWQALPADVPAAVRRLVRRCLQKDSRQRLQHIGDARLELEEVGEADASAGASSEGRRAITVPWTVAGAAMLIAVAAVIVLAALRPSATRAAPMRFSTVTNFSGVEGQPALSPDGRSVAFVSNRDGQWDIYVGLVTGGSPIRITNDPMVEARPRWSPDGAQLIFARLNDAGLYDSWVIPALGGTARRLVMNSYQPTWSFDGRSIAYSSGGAIWISEPSGANPRAVTHPEAFRADYQPAFSHDGRSIACVRRRGGTFGSPYGALMVVDAATGAETFLTADDALALSPVWSPDDRFIYFTSSRGGALNVWKIPAALGEPEQITAGQGDDTDIDLSADGRRLIFSSFRLNVNLAEVSLEPAARGRLKWLTTDSARGETAPRYSPDGRRIAYFSNRSGAERESIWVMDIDGQNATKIVEDENRTSAWPRWTADSQELVFLSRAWSTRSQIPSLVQIAELRRVSVNGGAPRALPIKPWSPSWGDISADERIIYRTSATAGEVYDLRTSQRHQIADLRGDPLWSRDGRAFVFIVRPGVGSPSDAGLWSQTPDGVRRLIFPGWVVWFTWTGAGQLLVAEGKPNLTGMLWRIDSDGRGRAVVLERLPMFMRHTDVGIPIRFDVHPDGRRIVVEALESYESDIGMIDNVR